MLIRKTDERYAAFVSWGTEPEASRTVLGETCEGVVEAALLVVAMNADDATEAVAPAPPPPAAPLSAASEPPPHPEASAQPAKKDVFPVAVTTAISLSGGSIADSRWMVEMGWSLGFEWRRGLRDVSWLKPRLALGASKTLIDVSLSSPFAQSDLSRLTGIVEACPTAHEIGDKVRLSFRPCTRFTGSVVWLETTSAVYRGAYDAVTHETGTWSTLGALGRLRLTFDVPHEHEGEGLFLELAGGVDFTLTTDRFAIYGRSPIAPDAAVATLAFAFGRVW